MCTLQYKSLNPRKRQPRGPDANDQSTPVIRIPRPEPGTAVPTDPAPVAKQSREPAAQPTPDAPQNKLIVPCQAKSSEQRFTNAEGIIPTIQYGIPSAPD